jgi:hypothetical protein
MDFFAHGGAILSANVPVGTFTVKYVDGLDGVERMNCSGQTL